MLDIGMFGLMLDRRILFMPISQTQRDVVQTSINIRDVDFNPAFGLGWLKVLGKQSLEPKKYPINQQIDADTS